MSQLGNKVIFAANLNYFIKRSGKTQKQVAEDCGIAPTTLNDYCHARRFGRIDRIEKLANYFGVPKSALIEENTGADGADISVARRKLIDLANSVSEEDAERLLQMMQLALNRK